MNYFLIFVFSVLTGFVGHFLYKFSNYNKIVALFFAVNESTWEHIKIGLTPLFLSTFIDAFFNGYLHNFWFNKFVSILCFVIILPLLFYTYKFVLKRHFLIIDIFIFVFSLIISVLLNYYLDYNYVGFNLNFIGVFGIFLFLLAYFTWAYNPPRWFLFKDPILNSYGLKTKVE